MTIFIINYKFVLVILGSSIRVAMQALRPVVVSVCVSLCAICRPIFAFGVVGSLARSQELTDGSPCTQGSPIVRLNTNQAQKIFSDVTAGRFRSFLYTRQALDQQRI